MVNDNVPSQLRSRKALREFAKDKPKEVQNLVDVICGQMRAHRDAVPSAKKVIKDAIEANLRRLAEMTR